jgi:phosphatidylglycerophosphatase A
MRSSPQSITSSLGARARVTILSWFGAGLVRRAPGTVGSIGAIPPAALIVWILGPPALAVSALVLFFVGWAIAAAHLKDVSSTKDPQWIVIDEVAGQWLTLAAAPFHPVWYVAGFVLFRVFDIFKPWPVSWADHRVGGALGIMLDDILAALYAALSLLALQLAWGHLI